MTVAWSDASTTVAQRFTAECRRLGMSQTDTAKFFGVRVSRVEHWEVGTSFPDAQHLEQMGRHGADVQYICTGRRAESAAFIWAQLAGASIRDAFQEIVAPADRRRLLLELLTAELRP